MLKRVATNAASIVLGGFLTQLGMGIANEVLKKIAKTQEPKKP